MGPKSCWRMRPRSTMMVLILIGKLVVTTMPLGVVVIGVKATLLAALAVMTTGMMLAAQQVEKPTTGPIPPQLLKSLLPYLLYRMLVGTVLLTTLLQLLEIGLLELVVLVPLMLRKPPDGNYKSLLNLKKKIPPKKKKKKKKKKSPPKKKKKKKKKKS